MTDQQPQRLPNMSDEQYESWTLLFEAMDVEVSDVTREERRLVGRKLAQLPD